MVRAPSGTTLAAAAIEVFGEVPFDRAVEPQPVLGVGETVTLVVGEIGDRYPALAQRGEDG
ncbi:hypothetical protein ACIRG5_47940 [Lentzea sp. NPDC102401]|uniref:hypothetical protein n=1 Tax=Lentzea sp. NPDC102401 TaxID=3364128 RepID=UPI003812D890